MGASLSQRSTYHLHPTGAPDRNLSIAESASRPSKSLSHASAMLSASESTTGTTSVETVSSLHRPSSVVAPKINVERVKLPLRESSSNATGETRRR